MSILILNFFQFYFLCCINLTLIIILNKKSLSTLIFKNFFFSYLILFFYVRTYTPDGTSEKYDSPDGTTKPPKHPSGRTISAGSKDNKKNDFICPLKSLNITHAVPPIRRVVSGYLFPNSCKSISMYRLFFSSS